MRWFAALALVAGFWPGAASAGLMGAEWGMTPEQVAAATPPAFAPRAKGSSGERMEGKTIGNIGRHASGKIKLRSVFYFDEAGLESIALSPDRPKTCRNFAHAILVERGKPLRVSDQTILMLLIWHDGAEANRIRLQLLGGGIGCTLYYERLSDYDAVDTRLLSEGR